MRRVVLPLLAASLLAPVVAGQEAPASAATTSLTVTTLGRDGHQLASYVQAQNIHRYSTHTLTGGRTAHLAPGTYDVLVDIFDPKDSSDTVAARRVKVSGATRITLDARKGRRVTARLTPTAPAALHHSYLMALCDSTGAASITGWTYGDSLYSIGSSVRSVELAVASVWRPDVTGNHSQQYLGVFVHKKGLPNGRLPRFDSRRWPQSRSGLAAGCRPGSRSSSCRGTQPTAAGNPCCA